MTKDSGAGNTWESGMTDRDKLKIYETEYEVWEYKDLQLMIQVKKTLSIKKFNAKPK